MIAEIEAAVEQVEILPHWVLEDGTALRDVPVSYRTWGRLAAGGDNAVIVCHALTGNTDVAAWWGDLLGPGRALDTERDFVVCANVLGSPYGSASPVTTNPATGQPYGIDFPVPSIRDTVALHRALLTRLGVRRLRFVIGGSMGGMQALEWAFHDDFVDGVVAMACGGRHSAWCIGISEAQRRAIYADPAWRDGRYASDAPPARGLAVARMMAMISYRSFMSFERRFGRQSAAAGDGFRYAIESYLGHQGAKLVARFDALCYVRLTESMDLHDIARGRGEYREVLAHIKPPTLIVGIDTDVLYPLAEQRELAEHIPNARLAVLESEHGHDAFLIEAERVNDTVLAWRRDTIDR